MGRKPKAQTNPISNASNKPTTLGIGKKSNKKLKSNQPNIVHPLPIDWNNNLVLSKIFEQAQFKDLVNMNTVCRQWHELANPMIYKSIKLLRYRYIQNQYHGSEKSPKTLKSLEIKACIDSNSKHSHLVDYIRVNTEIEPIVANDLFSTFCHLTKLYFHNLTVKDDTVLTSLRFLNKLISLKFDTVVIKEVKRQKFENQIVQLPSTLTRLELDQVHFVGESKLIKQTLATHKNLEEFIYTGNTYETLISPFFINYSTLKKLTLYDGYEDILKSKVTSIIESNSQLIELSLRVQSIDPHIIASINSNLTNLQVLSLKESYLNLPENPIHVQFTKPMNLISLTLHSGKLSVESFISILNKVSNLNELNITINEQYRRVTSFVRQKYPSLANLTYYVNPPHDTFVENGPMKPFFRDEINDAYYPNIQSLKTINFAYFNIFYLNPQYLDRFPNLEVVRFIGTRSDGVHQDFFNFIENHLKRFEGWMFKIDDCQYARRGYLYKPRTKLLNDQEVLNYLPKD